MPTSSPTKRRPSCRLSIIAVHAKVFFWAASFAVAAIYIYFHLNLVSLWGRLVVAHAHDDKAAHDKTVENETLLDHVFPWLVNHAALWYRDKRYMPGRKTSRSYALDWLVVIISIAFVWLAGLITLVFLWGMALPSHDTFLAAWTGGLFCLATLIGVVSFAHAVQRLGGARNNSVVVNGNHSDTGNIMAICVHAYHAFLSSAGDKFGRVRYQLMVSFLLFSIPLYTTIVLVSDDSGFCTSIGANKSLFFSEANLDRDQLTQRPTGWKPYEIWLGDNKRDNLTDDNLLKRWRNYIANLNAPILIERNLCGAIARRAFMPGVELEAAKMQGINLSGAQMQGAILYKANLRGAFLHNARMQGANLIEAILNDADLSLASINVANLTDANLTDANFTTVLAHSADLRCKKDTLTQEQLNFTVGDDETLLPDGLHVWSCLKRGGVVGEGGIQEEYPARIEDVATSSYPERLFCADGAEPQKVGKQQPLTETLQ